MRRTAVEFNGHSLVAPEAVDLVAASPRLDLDVGLGLGQAGCAHQLEEAVLELLADDLTWGVLRERLLQHAESPTPVGALNGGIEDIQLEEAQKLGLADGAQNAVAPQHVSQIHERASHGGHGNPTLRRDVVRPEPSHVVSADAGHALPRPSLGGDMNAGTLAVVDLPERGRVEVAEDRSWTAREDCGHPARFGDCLAMADRVHATMDAVQSAGLHAAGYGVPADAERVQLLA